MKKINLRLPPIKERNHDDYGSFRGLIDDLGSVDDKTIGSYFDKTGLPKENKEKFIECCFHISRQNLINWRQVIKNSEVSKRFKWLLTSINDIEFWFHLMRLTLTKDREGYDDQILFNYFFYCSNERDKKKNIKQEFEDMTGLNRLNHDDGTYSELVTLDRVDSIIEVNRKNIKGYRNKLSGLSMSEIRKTLKSRIAEIEKSYRYVEDIYQGLNISGNRDVAVFRNGMAQVIRELKTTSVCPKGDERYLDSFIYLLGKKFQKEGFHDDQWIDKASEVLKKLGFDPNERAEQEGEGRMKSMGFENIGRIEQSARKTLEDDDLLQAFAAGFSLI